MNKLVGGEKKSEVIQEIRPISQKNPTLSLKIEYGRHFPLKNDLA